VTARESDDDVTARIAYVLAELAPDHAMHDHPALCRCGRRQTLAIPRHASAAEVLDAFVCAPCDLCNQRGLHPLGGVA
jgi:hypothetical protein